MNRLILPILAMSLIIDSAFASPEPPRVENRQENNVREFGPEASLPLFRQSFTWGSDCEEYSRSVLHKYEQQIMSGQLDGNVVSNIQDTCNSVKIKYRTGTKTKSYFGSMEKFWWQSDTWILASIDITCVPRNLGQKQRLSQLRMCEQKDAEYCHDPAFLAELNQVRPTLINYEISGCLQDR